MIGVFTIALLTAEFGQVWAEHMRHDVSHSCGEDWKVNEAFRGITVIKVERPDDVRPQLLHDVTPRLRLSAKRWMVEL